MSTITIEFHDWTWGGTEYRTVVIGGMRVAGPKIVGRTHMETAEVTIDRLEEAIRDAKEQGDD